MRRLGDVKWTTVQSVTVAFMLGIGIFLAVGLVLMVTDWMQTR